MHGIDFQTLLRYEELECDRWEKWLARHPEALPVRVSDEQDIAGLVFHLLSVALRNAQRTRSEAQTPDDALPRQPWSAVFDIGREARRLLREYLARADERTLDTPIDVASATLGTFRSTPRRLIVHGIVHGLRHWAQAAALLRMAGHQTDWSHDFLLSGAME